MPHTYNYASLTEIIPTVVTGTVLPAAYGDQVREDLQAIRTGLWFKATCAVSHPLSAGVANLILMTSLDCPDYVAQTDTPYLDISSGYVLVSYPGIWKFGFNVLAASTQQFVSLDVATTTGNVGTEASTASNAGVAHSLSTTVRVTGSVYVSGWVFSSGAGNLSSLRAPDLYGVWMSEI